MPVILALDQGTTSSRAIVFDHAGRIVGVAQQEFRQIFPQAGWVEHDPRGDLADPAGRGARGAGAAPGSAPGTSPPSASPTSARPPSSGTARPARRSTTPSSGRTAARPASATSSRRPACGRRIQRKTGLVIDAYFSGSKLRWILDHVPGARARAERGELAFGTIDTWLAWKLTGGALHVTDPSNASRTMLFNIVAGEWDDELLRRARRAARPCCPRSGPRARSTARPCPASSARRSRSPASRATSRPRCSDRTASRAAWRRTPTAPAASC